MTTELAETNAQLRDLASSSSSRRRKSLKPRRYVTDEANGDTSVVTRLQERDNCQASGLSVQQPVGLSESYIAHVSGGSGMPPNERPSHQGARSHSGRSISPSGCLSAFRQILQAGSEHADNMIANESVSGGYLHDESAISRVVGLSGRTQEVGDRGQIREIERPELWLNGRHPDFILANQLMTTENAKQTICASSTREQSVTNCGREQPVTSCRSSVVDSDVTVGSVSTCSSTRHSQSGHTNVSGPPTAASNRFSGYALSGIMRQWQQNELQGTVLYVSKMHQTMAVIQNDLSSGSRPLQSTTKSKVKEGCQNQGNERYGVGMSVIVYPHEQTSRSGSCSQSATYSTVMPVPFASQPTRIAGVATGMGKASQQSDDQTSHRGTCTLPEHEIVGIVTLNASAAGPGEDATLARRRALKRLRYRMNANDPVYMERVRAKKRERYHARRQDPEYVMREREKKRERYHRSRQDQQTVEKTREKKRELYHRARQDPNWVNKTREKKKEIYYRSRQNPNWVTRMREKKREVYRRARENPEWIEKTREKKRELYHRARQDPLYVQKQRVRRSSKDKPATNMAAQRTSGTHSNEFQRYSTYTDGLESQHAWGIRHNSMVVNVPSLQGTVDGDSLHPAGMSDTDRSHPHYVVTATEESRRSQLFQVSQQQTGDSSVCDNIDETNAVPCATGNVKEGDENDDCEGNSLKLKLEAWKRMQIKRKHADVVYRAKKWARSHKQNRHMDILNSSRFDNRRET